MMIIKTVVFFFSGLLFAFLQGKAQVAIGLRAGYSNNQLQTDISPQAYTKNKPGGGYSIGIPVKFTLTRSFSLETAPAFLQKNYSLVRTGPYTGVYETFTNSYLQIPLTAEGELACRNIRFFFNAGIYGAYWMAGRTKGKIPDIYSITPGIGPNGQTVETFELAGYNASYSFSKQKDKRLEWGLLLATGISYFTGAENSLRLEAGYARSLMDQQEPYMFWQAAHLNRTFLLTFSFLHALHTAKNKKK